MQDAIKNMRICGGGESLIQEKANAYYTKVLDSGEKGNVWHRMSIISGRKYGIMYKVSIYASDDVLLSYKNRYFTIQEVLRMADGDERNGFLEKAFVKSGENPSDILLHDTVGRYLWCRIEVLSHNKQVNFESITVSTPAQSLLKYLPEIYQEQGLNSFTDRYLSVFQTVYEDFENEIFHSSAMYDVNIAPDEFIMQMAEWFAVEDRLLWTPKQLRAVLMNIHKLYRKRGTISALELIVEIFGETKAYFVETFHAMRYYGSSKQLQKLYSGNRFTLWIMVFKVFSDKSEVILRHLIEKNKPAHVDARLIILKPLINLDSYSYLGINSVVSQHPKTAINGQSMLGYTALLN